MAANISKPPYEQQATDKGMSFTFPWIQWIAKLYVYVLNLQSQVDGLGQGRQL